MEHTSYNTTKTPQPDDLHQLLTFWIDTLEIHLELCTQKKQYWKESYVCVVMYTNVYCIKHKHNVDMFHNILSRIKMHISELKKMLSEFEYIHDNSQKSESGSVLKHKEIYIYNSFPKLHNIQSTSKYIPRINDDFDSFVNIWIYLLSPCVKVYMHNISHGESTYIKIQHYDNILDIRGYFNIHMLVDIISVLTDIIEDISIITDDTTDTITTMDIPAIEVKTQN